MIFEEFFEPFISSPVVRKFKRGDIVYHEGDRPDNLYYLKEGLIGLFHISESGKETFLRVFSTGMIFGHRSHFAQTPYHATAISLTKSKVSVISKSLCEEICSKNPEFLKSMLQIVSRDLGNAELRLSGLQDKSAMTRIIEAMVFFKLKHPDYTWTRKEIAEFSGSTFETVTRVMSRLADEGLIVKEGRDFIINDPEELLQFDPDQG
jgi:CRP-like cAMP-binding protein